MPKRNAKPSAPVIPPPLTPWFPRARSLRIFILLLGIIIPQFVLYFDSLVGKSILLPLDYLQFPRMYLPDPGHDLTRPRDIFTSDLITVFEPNRVYAAEQVRAGHLPLWSLNNYCGSPFIAANHTAIFSPFRIIDYLWPSPFSIAWSQMLRALVAGIGAYLFFRIALRVAFIPALFGAWLFPHMGFLVYWNGFPIEAVATLLPWVLLATHRAVCKPGPLGGSLLALATAVLLVSGHAANAGHILLASGFYMIFSLINIHGFKNLLKKPALTALGCVCVGWFLGFLLAGPQMFSTMEYLQSSYRIANRIKGDTENVPQGWTALNQIIWPYFYGSDRTGVSYMLDGNLLESGAEAYIGLFTCLVLAPLGWRAPGLAKIQWFWVILGIIALGQVLDMPLLNKLIPHPDDPLRPWRGLFDLPPMNLLRNNRFALITGWCILSAAVAGLQALCVRPDLWRKWLWIPVILCANIFVWALFRLSNPDPYLLDLARFLQRGGAAINISLLAPDVPHMLHRFTVMYWVSMLTALAALLLWVLLRIRALRGWIGAIIIGSLCFVEVVTSAYGLNVQSDPRLYYPPIPFLQNLSTINTQRVCAVNAYVPNINIMLGLRDIRGYDAADPVRIVELFNLFSDPRQSEPLSYAATMLFIPNPDSRLLDMLNVRALISRGNIPELNSNEFIGGDDYFAWINGDPLPRAWVPTKVITVNDKSARLGLLKDANFDPGTLAIVEATPDVTMNGCTGSAKLTEEEPNRLVFDLDMTTDGVVVISDSWDSGWKAWVDGERAEVMPTNHALRGVRARKGAKRLEIVYAPFSFTLGLWSCGCALAVIVGWHWSGRMRSARNAILK